MAAPTPTARQTPSGRMLKDGYRTTITFSRDPDVSFWEKTVTPPGLDGGDAIDITTMHNNDVRTKAPRSLFDLTDGSATVAYDPDCINQILNNLLNQPGSCTVTKSDGSTLAFYGYLQKFEPQELTEGEHPEAEITVVCTNVDPATGGEELPVLTSVSGT